MSHDIQLAALVVRDGRLLLLRDATGTWKLPAGPLPDDADADEAMDAILQAHGINAPAVEEDFLQTAYLEREGRYTVFNLYGPSGWTGEPIAPAGEELGWFDVADLDTLEMDPQVRNAIYEVLGLKETNDDALLSAVASVVGEAMEQVVTETPAQPAGNGSGASTSRSSRFASRREAGLDVLGTLNATDGEKAARSMFDMYGPLTDDVLDFALGEVWADDTLDRRTKSLQVVAIIAAQGHAGPLRSHINGALNHGATPEQIVQTLRLVAVYAGFPAALEAWRVMEKVFASRGIKIGRNK